MADLTAWLDAGKAAWPDVAVAPDALAAHLARLGIEADDHPHAGDLVLACACAAGDPAAIAAFDRAMAPLVRAAVRRLDTSTDFADEIGQAIRERLLVARPDAPPRIAEYAGGGALAAWVRVAAVRLAMNQIRDRQRDVLVDDENLFDAISEGSEADRRAARARYGEACGEALRTALAGLSARERNLLRMHHLHGLTVDELSAPFKVHRATVARWLVSARERLLAETRAGLRERLALDDSAIDSVLRGLQSRIDITLSRLLAE